YQVLKADQVAALKEQLAKTKGVGLLSAPKIRALEYAMATISCGAAPLTGNETVMEPANYQVLLTVRMTRGVPPGNTVVRVSNCFDAAAQRTPAGEPKDAVHPNHQHVVRRTGEVGESGALLVVVPTLVQGGKNQLLLVSPRPGAEIAEAVPFSCSISEVD